MFLHLEEKKKCIWWQSDFTSCTCIMLLLASAYIAGLRKIPRLCCNPVGESASPVIASRCHILPAVFWLMPCCYFWETSFWPQELSPWPAEWKCTQEPWDSLWPLQDTSQVPLLPWECTLACKLVSVSGRGCQERSDIGCLLHASHSSSAFSRTSLDFGTGRGILSHSTQCPL